jgi:hypothetical protein
MPRKQTGRPPGRPRGETYTVARTMLLTPADLASLQRIAATWGCSNAEAVRRLIRERDQAQSLESRGQFVPSARIKAMQERLRGIVPSVDDYLAWKREEAEAEATRDEARDARGA